MIVGDTSALITLATADVLQTVLDEFDVHTTETVVAELRETASYEDRHAEAAEACIDCLGRVTVHEIDRDEFGSTRVDPGEGTCAVLARDGDADYLLTDDLRALPEVRTLAETPVAISPFVLKALVLRGELSERTARNRLEHVAEARGWLGAPIYRRAQSLFVDEE